MQNTTGCIYSGITVQVGGQFVVDASQEEESCAGCSLSVALTSSMVVCGVLKDGQGTLSYDQYRTALRVSEFQQAKL